jgi:hypothetical protein
VDRLAALSAPVGPRVSAHAAHVAVRLGPRALGLGAAAAAQETARAAREEDPS